METQLIQSKIHEIRGLKVMLDYDLANLYEVETKAVKQAVKRNKDRFPADFMFELSPEEFLNLRSHFVTSSWGGIRYAPYAFTEQGVAMLASVLRSEKAITVNISIVRAFVLLRKYALTYKELTEQIHVLEQTTNKRFKDVYEALNLLIQQKGEQEDWEDRERIGFKP